MKKKEKKTYATVFEDEGADYRLISQAMTDGGWKMNHTSARNHVLRIMSKFAIAYVEHLGLEPTEKRIMDIAKDSRFQSAISEMLQTVLYEPVVERRA